MSLVPLTLTSDLRVVGKKKVYKRVFRKCTETPGRARASVMLLTTVICLFSLAAAAPQSASIPVEAVNDAAPSPEAPAEPEAPFIAPEPRTALKTSPIRADSPDVAILRDDRQDDGDGNFNYAFEADNGISVSVVGTPGAAGQSNMEGSFRFTLPDGTIAEVTYIADENGFQPSSDLLPTPHPLPAHAIEQIRFAEEQRALGVGVE
ncbi:cuticle protein AM1199-like [Penaeus japonicus]|uniref:cuticle protein AM1199-like n=1 Tax=Penaeus japonicus TaxID=27405 RepID=UPI001C714CC6|nr:cuticle protein AM1199-like [Penaeus japonicus]